MKIKSKKISLSIAILSLTIIISGCTKQESELVINADGTMSGAQTQVISDNISQNFGFLNDVWQIQTPLEIINITMDSRNECTAGNVRFYVAAGQTTGFSSAAIKLNIADNSKTVYGFGDVTGSSDAQGDSYVEIANLTLFTKSGNVSDCAYLESVNSGSIALSSDYYSNALGSIELPNSLLQIANIPPAERIHFVLASQISTNDQNPGYERYPESLPCAQALSDPKFNVLNDRQMMPGEFIALLNDVEEISIHKKETSWEAACKFSNIPISSLSRMLPGETQEPGLDSSGRWVLADDEITWNFNAETFNPDTEVQEINMDGVYSPDELQAVIFAKETGTSINMNISGVVLATNGDFNATKNSVSWETAGVWNGSQLLTIPGGVEMRQPSMNVLVGHSVSFATNKSSWSNAKTFGGLKAKLASLKAASVGTIKIVGIKKFGLTGAAATANQKLVQKRVTAIKNKLNAAKVKAKIEIVYLTPDSITGGDSKYANKVVVQVINK